MPRAGLLELRDESRHIERVNGLIEVATLSVLVCGPCRPVNADPKRAREPVGRCARIAVRRISRAERIRNTALERLAEDSALRSASDERLRVDPLQRLARREVYRAAQASAPLECESVDMLQTRTLRESKTRQA